MIADILRGGAEKVAEASGVLVGGHTINDKEPKYGLSVMGLIHPDRILTKAGAQPGDLLLLTKPLGVGLITTALKGEIADPAHVAAAVHSMKILNQKASDLIQQLDVHACTDITGFALLGHGAESAEKSGVRLRVAFEKLPFLEGAVEYAEENLFPGGACKNQRYYREQITFDSCFSEEQQLLLFTPETSGGLLVAVPPEELSRLDKLFVDAGQLYAIVGNVEEGTGIHVVMCAPEFVKCLDKSLSL
jgi:selenide,water dikinase